MRLGAAEPHGQALRVRTGAGTQRLVELEEEQHALYGSVSVKPAGVQAEWFKRYVTLRVEHTESERAHRARADLHLYGIPYYSYAPERRPLFAPEVVYLYCHIV